MLAAGRTGSLGGMNAEPVLVTAVARMIVAVALHWGLKLDVATLVPVMLALEGLLAPWVRSKVSPVVVKT